MSHIDRNFTKITRCGSQYRTEALSPMGLKACHASYISVICRHPGISQDQLAQKLCINKSNVARQASILEEGGFITRAPSFEDKRVLKLYPTEKTLGLLTRILEIQDSWEDWLTGDLSEEEKQTLESILSRIKEKAVRWTEVL